VAAAYSLAYTLFAVGPHAWIAGHEFALAGWAAVSLVVAFGHAAGWMTLSLQATLLTPGRRGNRPARSPRRTRPKDPDGDHRSRTRIEPVGHP